MRNQMAAASKSQRADASQARAGSRTAVDALRRSIRTNSAAASNTLETKDGKERGPAAGLPPRI